ncbi:hypothetical protein QUF72_22435 [Desulfobacterales bacterium HSG2]|nr:hypothetical protein [Desulfobacterales bacterium HSG2]
MSHFFSVARNDRRGWDISDLAAVDSGSTLKKCSIFSVLPGMTGGDFFSVARNDRRGWDISDLVAVDSGAGTFLTWWRWIPGQH